MRKRAFITGIAGQDGSYLAEWLLGLDYEVHGLVRRTSGPLAPRLTAETKSGRLTLHFGDLSDGTAISRLMAGLRPDEIYNLAAQSDVRVSFDQPEYTADVTGTGTLRLLEAAAQLTAGGHPVRFYQAGSSEMFGAAAPPQTEQTQFHPRSPYAASKVAAHWYAVNYRESGRVWVANGVLFNHESPRRGENFVTRKITRAATRIRLGLQERLALGNLEAKRDWGFAGDYVKGMWQMLQHDRPDDFVLATGEAHTVREFVEIAFAHLGLDWRDHVDIDPGLFRPTEVDYLMGDATKARTQLGWSPQVTFKGLVEMMMNADYVLAQREALAAQLPAASI